MISSWWQRWRAWARKLKLEVLALYLAYRDPRTPWAARAVAALVVAYALSPIDLIPDPIPLLGYLDDLILLPLGIKLVLHLIPADVMADCRSRAAELDGQNRPANRAGIAIVVTIWLLLAAAGLALFIRLTA